MPIEMPATIRRANERADTLQLNIPAKLVQDKRFPFKASDEVIVRIDAARLIVEKSNGGK